MVIKKELDTRGILVYNLGVMIIVKIKETIMKKQQNETPKGPKQEFVPPKEVGTIKTDRCLCVKPGYAGSDLAHCTKCGLEIDYVSDGMSMQLGKAERAGER